MDRSRPFGVLFILPLLLCLLLSKPAAADDSSSDAQANLAAAVSQDSERLLADPSPNLKLRNTLIIGSGATLVLSYGFSHWWGSGLGDSFQTTNEGWFGSGTPYGGADKFGHLYANYAGVRLLTPIFEMAGNSRDSSVLLALWSTLGTYTAVEVIDGFSRKWRFSPQDAIANVAGVLLGRALETNPALDAILDFRLDYRRSPRSPDFDPFGDYSAERFVFAVKADGFDALRRNSFLRYLEVAAGYGTRGYDNAGKHYRDVYVGLSVNLARLLADGAYDGHMHTTAFQRGTDRLFDLVQFPSVAYRRWSAE